MKDKRVLKWCGAVLTFIFLLVWQHALLLESYASIFRKDNATPGADAIILLSNPNFLRLKHSLELGLDGFAPAIYVTTTPKPPVFEDLNLKYPTKMEWVTAVAKNMGVDTVVAALPTLGDGARSTFDEAYDALAWSKKQGYKRIIIVTNAFHSRRAHYAFEKVFEKSGVQVEIGAAPDLGFSKENWWLVDSGLTAYLTEPLKFMAYLVFDYSPKFIVNR